MMLAFVCRLRRVGILALTALILTGALSVTAGCGGLTPGSEEGEGAEDGDEDDDATVPIEGTYRVLSHMRNDGSCDAEGTPHDGDSYFLLEELDSERSAIGYFPCDSADNCEASGEPRIVFDELLADQRRWRGTTLDWEENGDACEMSRTENIARPTGGDLELRRRSYAGKMNGAEECSESFAEEQQGSLICERYDEITATEAE